ncbi:MAG: hypothetical protein NVV63_02400 [Opitutus sp.]|nr:hypothetical protein [Opitutus sp.]
MQFFSVSPMPCDLNGDGRTDYAWLEVESGMAPGDGSSYSTLSSAKLLSKLYAVTSLPGGGFSEATKVTEYAFSAGGPYLIPYRSLATLISPADVNGDGLTDFVTVYPGQIVDDGLYGVPYRVLHHNVLFSVGSSGRPVFRGATQTPIPSTVTVNGKNVVPYFDKVSRGNWFNDNYCNINNFKNGTAQTGNFMSSGLSSSSADNSALVDINGDGMADWVWYVDDAGATGWWVMYSRGEVFTDPVPCPVGWKPTVKFAAGLASPATLSNRAGLDLNGDGIQDYAFGYGSSSSPPTYTGIHLSSGMRGSRVVSVKNGLGSTSKVAYAPITSDEVYTTSAVVLKYPIVERRTPTYVVSDLFRDSGNSSSPAHFTYQYSGNRIDLSGRGSLGFHSFVTWDMETNVLKYQFLTQSFPMTGLTAREQTYRWLSTTTGTTGQVKFRLVSSHDNTVVFDNVVTGPSSTTKFGTVYPFISQAVESRWEDSSTANVTVENSSSPNSEAEGLFPLALPASHHIRITAKSWFDDQDQSAAPPTTIPGSLEASDTDATTRANEVYGYVNYSTFSALDMPNKITYGNLVQLTTDYGDGYTEKVNTKYESAPSGTNLTGLVDEVKTTVSSPSYNTQAAPIKTYDYKAGTPLVTKEKSNSTDDSLDFTTYYTRDSLGRVEKTEIESPSIGGRYTVSKVLTFDGRFDLPVAVEDAYAHPTVTIYDAILGKPIATTDVNGARVVNQYDAVGRLVRVRDDLRELDTTTSYSFTKTSYDSDDWRYPKTVTPPSGLTDALTLTSKYAVRTRVYGSPLKEATPTSNVAVDTVTSFQPPLNVYYDRLGRVIRTVKEGFKGQKTVTDTIYNTLGQVIATSVPYEDSTTPAGWTKTTYDPYGRAAVVTAPNGTTTTNTYNGRATTVSVNAPELGGVNPGSQKNTTVVDAKGRTVAVWNADNVPTFSNTLGTTSTEPSIRFTLDGFGRMRVTELKGQTQKITAAYDDFGRQTQLSDPDKGTWNYENDALGRVTSQTDAKGTVTTTTYDRLNRLQRRTITETAGPVETTDWYYYDWLSTTSPHAVAEGNKSWLLAPAREECSTTNQPGYPASKTTTVHYYTAKGQPAIDLSVIDGKYFYTHSSYDEFGRLAMSWHYWRPPGAESPSTTPYAWQEFGYVYTYNSESYLLSINDNKGRTWWKADPEIGYDHLDRPVAVGKGFLPGSADGLWTKRTYRATDGVLLSIKTGLGVGGDSRQNLSFDYDGLGNLRSRTGAGGTETLTYDNLNRLTNSSKQGATTYFENGNIRNKPVVGDSTTAPDFTYDTARPHAVKTARGYTMGYDANGNVISRTKEGETWSFRYAGFDKPRWMGKTTGTTTTTTVGSEFIYNANHSRVMQLEFSGFTDGKPSGYVRKRIYAMGSTLEVNYEKAASADDTAWQMKKVRVYVPGPDGVVGSREFDPTEPVATQEKAYIYHYDHLGSIERVTDLGTRNTASDNEGKPSLFSEDAWGQRRNPNTWTGIPSTTDDGGANSVTPRGFTGHEMLDDLGLVHMNGRIYDPLLGRMLSADVVVQDAGNLQAYNRYSYVWNNPLRFVDPTGFEVYAAARDLNGVPIGTHQFTIAVPDDPSKFKNLVDLGGGKKRDRSRGAQRGRQVEIRPEPVCGLAGGQGMGGPEGKREVV